MPQAYDTIVVGLGSAGTTAASTLAKAGRRVLALEAQDRIGGRVKTVKCGDGFVEEGAEWIHGTEDSRVYQAAMNNNITVLPQDLDMEVYRSDGSAVNRELMEDLISFCLERVGKPPDEPPMKLGNFITSRLMEYIKEKYPHLVDDKKFLKEFLDLVNLFVNNYEASNDWNDVSAQSRYEELGGHQHMSWHRYGYKTFFEILLNTYNNGPGLPNLDIKLNTEVTQIKWPRDTTGNVEVVCKDGSTYTASNVIVTLSLGVLKERIKMFRPPLPEQKITAIEEMSMGVMDKIIFKFDEPWWHDRALFYIFIWDIKDRENVAKDDYWITRIFAASNPLGSRNVLTLWTSGDVAKMIETLPENEVKSKCMQLLRRFMGRNHTIPEPVEMIRSTWFSNPFTRGSYSYDNLLTPQKPNLREDLASPLLDSAGSPRVLFAGEATNSVHFSTVHGAAETGYREAMRLLPSSKV
ncbi:uncharacterized protein LOC126974920 [Leptidea sinapis]|uniref:uncharacterized protein LOC126974920 n=1 Tax=Leptidea sinapis TaxID=189913 RepID=UPI0021278D3F|nr:uncharacterized protein LOC126974920 [Leptidea sinapis]